jgi:hypothetical protein
MCPQLTTFLHWGFGEESLIAPEKLQHAIPHKSWMEVDLPWVKVCDAVLRLPGMSVGADIETAFAAENLIPVFHSIEDLVVWRFGKETDESNQEPGHPVFLEILAEMKALHQKKATDYGSEDDPLANIRRSVDVGIQPWLAAWIRAKDKVGRIDQFAKRGTLANEGVADSLMDLSAYAIICLVLFRESEKAKAVKQAS